MKVAITGGIGSGKTLVTEIIKELGFDVILADSIGKEILVNDEIVKNKVKKEFGNETYKNDQLDTQYLAEKVFISKENVHKINSFVHPPTIAKIHELTEESLKTKNIVFVESALIYEAYMEDLFDYVILITCDEDLRIKRVIERDGISEEDVLARIENQIPEKEKISHADFIIKNIGTIDELKNKVQFFLTILKSLAK